MRPRATTPPTPPTAPTPRRAATWCAVALLAAVTLGGCGQEEPAVEQGTAPTTAPPESSPPESSSAETLDQPGLVALESATQAEGSTDAPPVVIEQLGDVDELTAGLDARLADAVRARARVLLPRVGDELRLVGGVVWVGCEVPSDVTVEGAGDAVTLTAVVPDKDSVQCLAPVTTVALATAPAG